MNKTIRVKNAFTLIELILVIILVSTISFLTISGFNFESSKKYKVTLDTAKEFMLKNFEFQNKLSLICIEDEALDCFIFIDGHISEDIRIENLFEEIPQVYNYDKDLSDFEFTKIRLNDIEYEPFFELTINSDKKHKSIVLDTLDEKVYLFSSIFKKVKKFNSTNEITDKFIDNEIEVKDAL